MRLARGFFTEPFVTILGDEVYLNSNHAHLSGLAGSVFDAVCGLMHTNDLQQIKRNYGVQIQDCQITRLIEKPVFIKNNLLGCGTYIFTPRIFDAIEATSP